MRSKKISVVNRLLRSQYAVAKEISWWIIKTGFKWISLCVTFFTSFKQFLPCVINMTGFIHSDFKKPCHLELYLYFLKIINFVSSFFILLIPHLVENIDAYWWQEQTHIYVAIVIFKSLPIPCLPKKFWACDLIQSSVSIHCSVKSRHFFPITDKCIN